jgi:hypothetical protein
MTYFTRSIQSEIRWRKGPFPIARRETDSRLLLNQSDSIVVFDLMLSTSFLDLQTPWCRDVFALVPRCIVDHNPNIRRWHFWLLRFRQGTTLQKQASGTLRSACILFRFRMHCTLVILETSKGTLYHVTTTFLLQCIRGHVAQRNHCRVRSTPPPQYQFGYPLNANLGSIQMDTIPTGGL